MCGNFFYLHFYHKLLSSLLAGLTLALTVERYIAVCRPHQHRIITAVSVMCFTSTAIRLSLAGHELCTIERVK